MNINAPPIKKSENWPQVSFFAIYDGHGKDIFIMIFLKELIKNLRRGIKL